MSKGELLAADETFRAVPANLFLPNDLLLVAHHVFHLTYGAVNLINRAKDDDESEEALHEKYVELRKLHRRFVGEVKPMLREMVLAHKACCHESKFADGTTGRCAVEMVANFIDRLLRDCCPTSWGEKTPIPGELRRRLRTRKPLDFEACKEISEMVDREIARVADVRAGAKTETAAKRLPSPAELADYAARLRKWAARIDPHAERQLGYFQTDIRRFLRSSLADDPVPAAWYDAAAKTLGPRSAMARVLYEAAGVLGALTGPGPLGRYKTATGKDGWPPAGKLCRIADELDELAGTPTESQGEPLPTIQPAVNPDQPAHLPGTTIDREWRTISRNGKKASFASADMQWRFVMALADAGADGIEGEQFIKKLWPAKAAEQNALAQLKSSTATKLTDLRLEVVASKRGVWKIAIF